SPNPCPSSPPPSSTKREPPMTISRRQFGYLAGAGLATGAAVGGSVALARGDGPESLAAAVPFAGIHQAGITTAAQDHLHFAVFDVLSEDPQKLAELLREWTKAARRMTRGAPLGQGSFAGPPEGPPEDTGEATGLAASALSITIGFGPGLFVHPRLGDRFGLARRRPRALAELPQFPGDDFSERRTSGDLALQVCANDPLVAAHAVRNLARIGFGTVSLRWAQLGFGRTSATTSAQETPRNLFGQKDGTSNIRAEDASELREHVWVQPADDPAAGWMTNGSYLVARRISMHIETWDRTALGEQESIIGRFKGSGAPLTGQDEFDPPDFAATKADGTPVISPDAHVRIVHPSLNEGTKILRRGYNFVDGADPLGRMNAGLFFVSFQRDPQQFIRLQKELARRDVLNEYIRHTGSGLWACPPGLQSSASTWADHLFDEAGGHPA
ncbi:MAG: iron uptake transporter deferrochelatase/peroxidase subunit, partial [Angustibacter sp.]